MKEPKSLPIVLSKSEVKAILDATTNLKHKAILTTIYAAGLRVSESANLKISNIDSKNMQIFIHFKKYYYTKELKFTGDVGYLEDKADFKSFVDKQYKKEWVVYCRPRFKNVEFVLEYLGRYIHRVAISNNRIVKMENDCITFKYRDYKDDNKKKFMTVTAEEFIRRFLMHVLPSKFVKIRHYGILSNKNRNRKLKNAKYLLELF